MPVPELIIEKNEKLESEFLTRLQQIYMRNRGTEPHTSDATLCPRLSLFRRFNPKPLDLKTLMFFIDGESRGYAAVIVFGQPSEVKGADEYGIRFSLDVFDTVSEAAIELKSTRGNYPVQSHEYWMRQIAFYMLQVQSEFINLIVMRLNPKRDQPPFEFYTVRFKDEQAKQAFNEYRQEFAYLWNLGITQRNPAVFPRLKEYPNKFPCADCPYLKECGELVKIEVE